MKEFRKTKDDLFVCEECLRTFTSYVSLSLHIRHSHKNLSLKDYHDKWIKEEHDGKCKICNSDTEFNFLYSGYKKLCKSKKCKSAAYKLNMINTYGVDNPRKSLIIQEKTKKTNIKRYGGNSPASSKEVIKKIKETKLKKHGNENFVNVEKIKKTKLEKYGDENYNNSDKTKKTNLKKYGVEVPLQNEDIFNKAFKTRIQIHQYKNTKLIYQSSYELDFLEKFYDIIKIENAPTINYLCNEKNKIYFPDFYIPSLNLIVEIKSSYILSLDENISYKKEYCKKRGYNFILILDKNYKEFNRLIKSTHTEGDSHTRRN